MVVRNSELEKASWRGKHRNSSGPLGVSRRSVGSWGREWQHSPVISFIHLSMFIGSMLRAWHHPSFPEKGEGDTK